MQPLCYSPTLTFESKLHFSFVAFTWFHFLPVFQGQIKVKGQKHRGSEKVWERLQPVVKCRHDNMTLTVRRRGVGQLLLHPGEAASQSSHLYTGENDGDINILESKVWKICMKCLHFEYFQGEAAFGNGT